MSKSMMAGRPPLKQYKTDISSNVIPDGASDIFDGRKVVAVAGTAEVLASDTPCKEVIIMAETDNTDVVAIGASTVVADLTTRQGIALFAGSSITLTIDNLSKVFIDAVVSSEGVTFIYLN